ncbi:terminase, partial [Vibrio diabolicus]
MARRIKSVTQDPRYPALVKRYRYDWKRLAVELVGKKPSWQQRKIIDSAQRIGARTTVSSGHGTGKS